MNDLISIIIPVYNHAKTLEKSLRSILAQTYRPLEVIIVNDGSTDDFSKVAEKILKKYSALDIKIIEQAQVGANATRNRGFAESLGQYVIFWDADTVAKKEMLTQMYDALKDNPNSSYAYCQFRFGWKKMKSHVWNLPLLRQMNFIDMTSLLRRADFISLDENLKRFQDWDLWLTLAEKNKIGVFVPKVLFTKLVGGRQGISNWLPSWFYNLPWKTKKVKEYELAKGIVLKKHRQ